MSESDFKKESKENLRKKIKVSKIMKIKVQVH